jgi:multidrug efflux pump subunit AcrA (membrane-fusion protein)
VQPIDAGFIYVVQPRKIKQILKSSADFVEAGDTIAVLENDDRVRTNGGSTGERKSNARNVEIGKADTTGSNKTDR